MGCCLSAGDHHPEADHASSIHGAPPTSPPAVIEEETVKEVLLEIPVVPKKDERIKAMPPAPGPPAPVFIWNSGVPRNDKEDIVTEVSEICSYSESFSNATAPEKKDDDEDGVVNQRPPPRKRQAQGGGRGSGEKVVARRIAPPAPEKRGQVAPLRPVRGRTVASQPRNVAEENVRKRDAGEDPIKRSKSPVRCAEADARRNAGDGKIPAMRESANDVVQVEEAETLENPVVSLECFIFL